jgi:predicted TIM-barrel fold metal-dependent hydrolase
MQHPSERFGNHEMFESSRRWMGGDAFSGLPTEATVAAMNEAGVYLDTSAYTVRRYSPALVEYMKGLRRERVLFATIYPMISPVRCLEGLESLGFDEETTESFLAGNPPRIRIGVIH